MTGSAMAGSGPLVTVVTPVFNGAPYLRECVESVLQQTYRNIEYVIVDNHSTDDSRVIAESLAADDDRVRVRSTETHLPMMENWNFSLSFLATDTKYCKVVHADDWIKPTCIEQMVDLAERYPSVGLVGAYRLEEDRPNLRGIAPGQEMISGRQAGADTLRGRLSVFGSPTQLLIRADLIREQRAFYDESMVHADKDACLRSLMQSDFGFVSEILTYTRRHNESKSSAVYALDPRRIENLTLLKRYGEHYLGEDFPAEWKSAVAGYHRYLARRLLNGSGVGFWRFQRRGLEHIGVGISYRLLAWELFLQLANLTDMARRLNARLKRAIRHEGRAG